MWLSTHLSPKTVTLDYLLPYICNNISKEVKPLLELGWARRCRHQGWPLIQEPAAPPSPEEITDVDYCSTVDYYLSLKDLLGNIFANGDHMLDDDRAA